MRYFTAGAAALAAVAFANVAAAQEPERIEPIVIEALPLSESGQGQAVQPVTVLSGDELLRQQEASLGATLADEPGISSADFGVAVGRPVIRGLSGARVRVLENGLGSADVSSLSADHAVTIDAFGARQIEVLKGPATLLYGSGAIGGVVNVVTDRIPRSVPTELSGRANLAIGDSTLDYTLGRLELNGGIGPLAWNLQGYRSRSDDYQADDDRLLPNSDTETDYYSGGASWTGERGYLGAAVSGFNQLYGIPGEDAFIDIQQYRFDVAGTLLDPFPGFTRLEVAAAYTDYLHTESGLIFFDREQTELRLELGHQQAAGWTGVLGLQARRSEFKAFGEEESFVPPTDTQAIAAFAVEERPLGPWTLQLGLRVEQLEHDVSGNNPDRDFTPVSGAVGLLLPVGGDTEFAVNLGRYQRAPSAQGLYSFGPHEATLSFERGDVDLDEETARSLDLGLRDRRGRFRWSANVFYFDYQDFIFKRGVDRGLNADGTGGSPVSDGVADRVTEEGRFDRNGELLLLDFVAADARFFGGEVTLGYDLLEGPTALTLRVFGDIVDAELDDGRNLPRIPPVHYGIGLDYDTGWWRATAELLHATEQDNPAPLLNAADSYTDMDLFLGYRLADVGAGAIVFVRGENLLDEEVIRNTSFRRIPQPGRRFTTGVRVQF